MTSYHALPWKKADPLKTTNSIYEGQTRFSMEMLPPTHLSFSAWTISNLFTQWTILWMSIMCQHWDTFWRYKRERDKSNFLQVITKKAKKNSCKKQTNSYTTIQKLYKEVAKKGESKAISPRVLEKSREKCQTKFCFLFLSFLGWG